jgi:hypothetical protein
MTATRHYKVNLRKEVYIYAESAKTPQNYMTGYLQHRYIFYIKTNLQVLKGRPNTQWTA